MKAGLWKYRGQIVRVVDGDTLVLDIDLGLNVILKNQKIRLARISAPEGQNTDAMIKLLEFEGNKCYCEGVGKDKYGRWLFEVYAEVDDADELEAINLSDYLLRLGVVSVYGQ
ncbi:MAG: hypothetical protein KatS3mg087_1037 [Patescibacteria group bacterium]|nr:MAG: hypothetical protein KatS3mg087_1037 [Patescibacteria group bacterium]